MEKIPQRIKKSYEAYLKFRQEWANKKYGLDRELTLREYAEAHIATANKLKNEGKKKTHVARKIAGDDRTFTKSEASAIIRRLKDAERYSDVDIEGLNALREKYKKSSDIYGAQLSDVGAQQNEMARRQYYLDRGIIPEFIIQASARQKIFNELLDIGLSYKEADEVLYG